MKLKLFVLTHKEITSSKYDPSYMIPLYNNKCHNDMDDFNDKCMYETYMIYDVYKNQYKYFDDDTKYVGFCHYRRYFDINYNNIIDLLDNNKIILPTKTIFFIETVLQQFNNCHDLLNNDFRVIKTIIDNNYPEYTNDLIEFLNQNTICLCNMFICNRQIFNEYCSWIFDIMQQYFKYYNINNYGDMYRFEIEHINKYPYICYVPNDYYHSIEYQCHIGGFLAERLLNVFFLHNYANNIEYIDVTIDN